MNSLPPITSERIAQIKNNLKDFPEIHKYYRDWLHKVLNEESPRTYPIVKQLLMENYEYLKLLNQVLAETSTVKGFPTIVKHSKNKTEFYDELSILKLGKMLKNMDLTIEFISPGEGPRPDLKAEIWDRQVFFEVKHLRDVEEASNLLFDFFNEYPSKNVVSIALDDTITLSEVEECIKVIKDRIETKQEEDFPQHLSLGYADVSIKISKPRSNTPISVFSGVQLISFERTKLKIQTTFHEASRQLKTAPPTSPCLIVYDIDNWKVDFEDLERTLYGDSVTDVTLDTLELQKMLYGLRKEETRVRKQKIVEAFKRGFFNVLRKSLLIPEFSYSLQNGLFLSDESKDINGVMTFRRDQHKLFPNPFVSDGKLISYSKLAKMLTM